MAKRGFLFSLDALMAFWLVITLTTSLVVFSQQSFDRFKWSEYETLGRDYLEACPNGCDAQFEALTGLYATTDSTLLSGSKVSASIISYPQDCFNNINSICLFRQDLDVHNPINQVILVGRRK
ncbi:MAG: hypothetical protein ABH803_00500 [Candidatus Micrarchaeota archaeon]